MGKSEQSKVCKELDRAVAMAEVIKDIQHARMLLVRNNILGHEEALATILECVVQQFDDFTEAAARALEHQSR